MRSNRFWITLFFCILLLCGGLSLFLLSRAKSADCVRIVRKGVTVETLELTQINGSTYYELDGGITLELRQGDIRIVHADCPDGVCLERGWLSEQAAPIVCVPNQLVISAVERSDGFDAVVS